MIARVAWSFPLWLALSCAATSPSSRELADARRAYESEARSHCALRDEKAQRRREAAEQDLRITYNATLDVAIAVSSRVQGEAAAVRAALGPRVGALRECAVGEPNDDGVWRVTFTVVDRAFAAHDPRTADCVSGVAGAKLTDLDLSVAEQVDILVARRVSTLPSLEKPEIKAVIDAHVQTVRACYEAALRGWPELEGEVVAKFLVAPDWTVSISAVAKTTLAHPGVECCIMNAVDTMRFPPVPNKGIVVLTYPFEFVRN